MKFKNNYVDRLFIRQYRSTDIGPLIELLKLNTPLFFHASEQKDYLDYLQHNVEDYFVVEEDRSVVAAEGVNYFEDQQQARIAWDLVHPNGIRKIKSVRYSLDSELSSIFRLLCTDSLLDLNEKKTAIQVFYTT